MANIRSRGWCFTTNNYDDESIERLDDVSTVSRYLIYGYEEAPSTGTPHLQGYIYFENAKTFSKIQKILPKGSHIEVAKGNALENRNYCIKDQNFKEYGTVPDQGKRSDIEIVKEEIKSGRGMREIIEIASNYQTLKTAEMVLKYKENKRNWKPYVLWIHGESGSGKTRAAYELLADAYRKSNSTGKWWDGYDAHENVIIDDVKDMSKEMYSHLLEILDRYDCRVEVKGGSRQFLGKKIIVTSLLSPKEMYSQFNDAKELLRRIDEIKVYQLESNA